MPRFQQDAQSGCHVNSSALALRWGPLEDVDDDDDDDKAVVIMMLGVQSPGRSMS